MIKILFIGGTGNISTSVSRRCIQLGYSLSLLTRGTQQAQIEGAETISCDINNQAAVERALAGRTWDAVVNWIAFTPAEVERDIKLFAGKTGQYVFISSASCYQKPVVNYRITESTPLYNPFWKYSQDKIACEEMLMKAWQETDFPCTIVRPSHTYDTVIPIPIGGWHEYTTVDRIKRGLPIISHGDGTSLWVLTHASDFAKGFAGLLGETRAIGQAYHITSDEVLTWDQIYRTIGEAVGVKPKIIHIPSDFIGKFNQEIYCGLVGDKANSVVFDNTKIKSLVPAFICETSFAIGIRRTIKWFESDASRRSVLPATNNLIEKIIAAYSALLP